MSTPLQSRSYELLLRIATVSVEVGNNDRARQIAMQMFNSCLEVSIAVETATAASDRLEFRQLLTKAHGCLKQVKLWLRLLDDLGRIEPEAAFPMATLAEEVHRLLLAALRTSNHYANSAESGLLTVSEKHVRR